MTIIKTASTNGLHPIESQSHRTTCWLEGYITVPLHLEEGAWASGGYCDLDIDDGVLVGITPTERPVEPEPTHTPDPVTETQLAVAELAQVMEDNHTTNQLAIAELAGIILGG